MSDVTAQDDPAAIRLSLIARDLRLYQAQAEIQQLHDLQAAAEEGAEARFKEVAYLTREVVAARKAQVAAEEARQLLSTRLDACECGKHQAVRDATDDSDLQTIAALQAERDSLKATLVAERAAKARYQAEAEALDLRITELLKSRSWRITAPIRRLTLLLRR